MWGDQLVGQWYIIRANDGSPNGLTVIEIAEREETGICTIYRELEALQAARFPLYTERAEKAKRWDFTDTFKFRIPFLFTFCSVIPRNAIFTEPRTAAWV